MDSIFSDQAPVSVSAVAASNRIQGKFIMLDYCYYYRVLSSYYILTKYEAH